ncbi:MAG: GNAT family N-acetyltransferase [Bacteroidetes bacterium CG12_big_fil_rev_8_21_14_0_65_60_17]|nr:MAG: GNAT family N-acetyltransferase [Bacteroidetes bacterium CG12_big_fil_rev_8_21_14_0_65_60_17]
MGAGPGNIRIVRLGKAHQKDSFDCGIDDLNVFLKRYATQNARKGISVTYVAVHPGSTFILGYYCISNGEISYSNLAEQEARKLPRYPVPVVRLGRLATSVDARGSGIGALLLMDALRRSLLLAEEIGIAAVEVDAKTDDAKRFYGQYGFQELADDRLHLYLPMRTIQKLFNES